MNKIRTDSLLAQGSHQLSLDSRKYTLNISYGSAIQTLFLITDKQDNDYLKADKMNEDSGYLVLLAGNGEFRNSTKMESIHGRGNSTWHSNAKKSYAISLAGRTPLIEDSMPSKKWVLLCNKWDESQLKNKSMYILASEIGLPYTPKTEYMDVYLNGAYEGLYLLSNKINISSASVDINDMEEEKDTNNELPAPFIIRDDASYAERKGKMITDQATDITGGYLLEYEFYERYTEEQSGFITSRGQPIVIKEPEHASAREVDYIADLYQEFEDSIIAEDGINPLTGKHYSEYIDMDSWVKKYFIEEISKNVDFGLTSNYFYKPEGETSKLYAGPIWDYDNTFQEPDGLLVDTYKPRDYEIIYSLLYNHQEFQNAGQMLYRNKIREKANELFYETIYEMNELIRQSRSNDSYRWEIKDVEAASERQIEFYQERMKYLDTIWDS